MRWRRDYARCSFTLSERWQPPLLRFTQLSTREIGLRDGSGWRIEDISSCSAAQGHRLGAASDGSMHACICSPAAAGSIDEVLYAIRQGLNGWVPSTLELRSDVLPSVALLHRREFGRRPSHLTLERSLWSRLHSKSGRQLGERNCWERLLELHRLE